MRPQRTNRRSIYGGLAISLAGVAVVFVTTWLFGFALPVKVGGAVIGSALIYGGWRLTERG
jgi:hypothetical protein